MKIEKSTGYISVLPPRVFHVYQSEGKASFASLQNVNNLTALYPLPASHKTRH
jgi:hypothetical protein